MKTNHAVSLLQTGYTTVEVVFAPYDEDKYQKIYTYKAFFPLKKGDFVVVPANNYHASMQVAQVVEVHEEPKINLDVTWDYKWLIAKVDITAHTQVIETEEQQKETLQKLQAQKVRAEALEGLKNLYGEDVKSIECNVTKHEV